ncbi:glucoamylase family protein [Parabacteroides sp. FAFU027]|uniref:glucoamylase family protein n=1 Tax=Parabacteroides sp. FAFU027 TaxID=2922715 RepID=UPI001FB00E6E|nr:glucoamylase family protein [Parabacteroides sp. FAFU027]
MKKFYFYLLLGLVIPLVVVCGQVRFAIPGKLQARGYQSHVELMIDNPHAFIYEIYVSADDGKHFRKHGETSGKEYLCFLKNKEQNSKLLFRIMPKGMSVSNPDAEKFQVEATTRRMNDSELLDMVQRYTTRYFMELSHPDCGMARERSNDPHGDIVTTGGTGFGIMALIAAAERNYYPREKVFLKIQQIVTFLERAERFHGAWAHWYNGNTAAPFSFSRYDDGGDLVETAFLMQGLLTARQYFKAGNDEEQDLSYRINKLWKSVEWNWYTRDTDSLYWHWSKNWGWKMNHRIKGFDETLITYILAASSPTYPIRPDVYHACYTKSDYFLNGKTYYGIRLPLGMELGGPLFFTHYSFLGLNPKGLKDKYADYWERNRAHVLIHRAYALDNPKKWKEYGANCWGFTSSDDPLVGYTSHHPGTNDENGTISPTAALSSLPYTPELVLPVYRYFYEQLGDRIFGPYGFYDAFNLSLVDGQQVVHSYLAIDQGPTAVMIENYRSELLWKLFMQNDEIKKGLSSLGFYYKN